MLEHHVHTKNDFGRLLNTLVAKIFTKRTIKMRKKSKNETTPQQYVSDIVAIHEMNHRQNTLGVNHALMRHIDEFCGRPAKISDVTEDFCIAFSEFLASHVSKSSVKTYMQKLHAILDHAVAVRVIPSNPMPPVKAMVSGCRSAQRVYLTRDEIVRLSQTSCRHEETKRAFLFACQTGLRLSDIETLAWDDLTEVGGRLSVSKVQVKTGREVRVPLNAVAQELLGDQGGRGKVFSLMSRSVIASDLQNWAEAAAIDKHLTFHVSRHTFATLAIAAGVDIYVVSRLCGHTTVRTTEIYAHIIDEALLQGVSLLENAMLSDSAPKRGRERVGIWGRIKKMLAPRLPTVLK